MCLFHSRLQYRLDLDQAPVCSHLILVEPSVTVWPWHVYVLIAPSTVFPVSTTARSIDGGDPQSAENQTTDFVFI